MAENLGGRRPGKRSGTAVQVTILILGTALLASVGGSLLGGAGGGSWLSTVLQAASRLFGSEGGPRAGPSGVSEKMRRRWAQASSEEAGRRDSHPGKSGRALSPLSDRRASGMLRGWAGPGAGGLRDEDGGEGGRGRRGARSASANRAGGRAGRGSAAHEPGGWREGAGGGAEDRPFGTQEHLAEHPIGPGGYPLVRVGDKMLPVVRPDGSPGDPKFPFLPEIPESRKLPVGALAFVTTIEANGAGRNVLTSDGARQTFKEGYGRTLAACHEAVLIPKKMEEDAAKSPAKGKAEKDAAKATGSGRTGTVAGVERNEKQGMALIRFEDGFEMSCSKTMDCYNWGEGQKVAMAPQPYGTFYEVKQVRRLGGESTITLAENGNGPRIQVQCPYDAILCSSWMDKNKQESHALLLPKEVALGPGSTGKEPIIKAKVKEAKSLPEATLYSLSPGGQFYAPNTSSLHGKYAAGDTMDLTFDPQCRQEVIQQKLVKKDGTVLKFGSGFTMFCKPTDYCSKFEKGQEVVVDSRITGKQGVGTGPEPAGSTHH